MTTYRVYSHPFDPKFEGWSPGCAHIKGYVRHNGSERPLYCSYDYQDHAPARPLSVRKVREPIAAPWELRSYGTLVAARESHAQALSALHEYTAAYLVAWPK